MTHGSGHRRWAAARRECGGGVFGSRGAIATTILGAATGVQLNLGVPSIIANQQVLTLLVELGVAIAGFSAIVVALDQRPVRRWTRIRRDGLRSLLQVSGVVIAFSLAPLVLGRWFAEPAIWGWLLLAYGMVHVADVLSFLLRHTAETPTEVKAGARFGLLIAVLQVAIALLASPEVAEMVYVAVLFWHLAIAAASFLYLLHTHDTEEREEQLLPRTDLGSG